MGVGIDEDRHDDVAFNVHEFGLGVFDFQVRRRADLHDFAAVCDYAAVGNMPVPSGPG